MMYIPSISTILGAIFIVYIAHSIWTVSQLFMTLKCTDEPCYRSFLNSKPRMQLALFTSTKQNPISTGVTKIYGNKSFNYWESFEKEFEINVPLKTRRNGSLFMQVVLAYEGEPLEWESLRREGPTVINTLTMTEYMIPEAETFQLLGEQKPAVEDKSRKSSHSDKPFTHIHKNIYVTLLTDKISLSHRDVPPEMARLIHINRNKEILPILKQDTFNTRLQNLVRVTRNTTEFKINFHYKPIGIGKLRLMLTIDHAMQMVQQVGFSNKDVDGVKGLFSDTNVYLLGCTVFVSSVHLLFDFLAFKNDILFWRKKKSYEGLSTRTTLWRAFSQIIIFFYLLDEHTSMLVLVPAALGGFIELWKCKKILKIDFKLTQKNTEESNSVSSSKLSEEKTEEFDKQGMKYLSYLLYPLCIAGAIYSLIYQPHKSWYSWTLNSLVNGVYAFGFLFMLPQLFVNYKLKSVAALPWRAFMYKAFNTFIDDFFAFIIAMPTAHRVACLRDDIVFLIYLYQRWLYPVDKSRLDTGAAILENSNGSIKSDEDKKKQ